MCRYVCESFLPFNAFAGQLGFIRLLLQMVENLLLMLMSESSGAYLEDMRRLYVNFPTNLICSSINQNSYIGNLLFFICVIQPSQQFCIGESYVSLST